MRPDMKKVIVSRPKRGGGGKFYRGPGYAPSAVMSDNGVQSGVAFVADNGE